MGDVGDVTRFIKFINGSRKHYTLKLFILYLYHDVVPIR